MIFLAEKQEKTILKFFFSLIKHNKILLTMDHQKILNLLNEARDSMCQENGTFSMINQMQIMMQEMKLSTIQK